MAHILLVDDEIALTAVLRPVLAAAGHHVTTAASGAEAVRQAGLLLPDVILLDLGLPDQDGKAVIRTLRIKHDVPIIVISARHQEGEKIAALDEGADDYVDKPFEIGELMARIRVVLRRKPGAEAATRYKSGPLSVEAYGRFSQLQRLDRDGLASIAYTIRTLATTEGLTAHRNAVDARFRDDAEEPAR